MFRSEHVRIKVQVRAEAEPEPLIKVRVWPVSEPETRTLGSVQVRTGFRRFANRTVASLGLKATLTDNGVGITGGEISNFNIG
jgi:hypothetical protein